MQQTATIATQLDPKLLLKTLRAFRKGDFSARLPLDLTGVDNEIAEAFNDIAELNQGLSRELDRVAKVVGKEGQIGEGGRLPAAPGRRDEGIEWGDSMVGERVQPTPQGDRKSTRLDSNSAN